MLVKENIVKRKALSNSEPGSCQAETENHKKRIVLSLIELFMILLTLLSFLKGIWVSLDIDESYAVAVGYRMARGDWMIRDMWEPHQFSGFLTALLTAPYVWIRGNTDYLVIYLRIAGILIHTGLGLALYRQLKKELNRFFAFGIMILHLNFLPKWVQMPEFELMHYWCLLGIFLVLHAYFTHEKPRMFLPFAGGCLLVCSMLCYPTMILLYPFYILAVCILEKQCFAAHGKAFWKSSFFFTLGAFLSGAVFLAFLFSYMSPDEFKRCISYLFMDTSHGVYTMGEKWTFYLEQVQVQLRAYSRYLFAATGVILAICLVYRIFFSKNLLSADAPAQRKNHLPTANLLPAITAIFVLTGILMQGKAIYSFLFEDKNQFFFQIRYMAFLLPAILLGICRFRKMAVWLFLCVIPGLVSVIAVLFVTNMDTNVTYAKAFWAVPGSLIILELYRKEIMESSFWGKIFPVLQYAAGTALLAGLLVCRLLLLRVSGCLPVTIMAPLEKMENGPEKGIWVLADTAAVWNDNYRELEKYITEEDKVLYIGAENLIYAKMEALPATPSTQGTTVYNEMFLYYYEEHPDRIPNVIIYDKTFGENPAYALSYAFSLQNPVLFQWIEENYGNAQKIETEYMILLRKE